MVDRRECLFSEIVGRCGLKRFENVGASWSHVDSWGAGKRPRKTINLPAHLVMVPATTLSRSALAESVGDVPVDLFLRGVEVLLGGDGGGVLLF